MAQKVMNEEELREYVESEVRKALMNESVDEGGLLSGLLGGALGNGLKMPSMESIIGAVLGNVMVAPILAKLLDAIGISAKGPLGRFIIETAVTAGGARLGDWIDKNSDPIGVGNMFFGSRPQMDN